ncbi:MAG: hypothetical protein DRZ82_10345 [Thermoprotei archaeon]|nr:MAG: hypothetical protein DRZ82_10345 [Thermoprotei archaeon]
MKGRVLDFLKRGATEALGGREVSLPIFEPAGDFFVIRTKEGALTIPKKITIRFVGASVYESDSYYVEYVADPDPVKGIRWIRVRGEGNVPEGILPKVIEPNSPYTSLYYTTDEVKDLRYPKAYFPVGYYIIKFYPYEVEKVRIRVVTPDGEPVPIDIGYVAPPDGYIYAWYAGIIGQLKDKWNLASWYGLYINEPLVNKEIPNVPSIFLAFQFFKVNYLGNGTYEYYVPKNFTVPIYFIFSKPIFDKENRILLFDVPLGYIFTINSKIWRLGMVTGGKNKEVTFVVPIYKLTINTTNPELLDKLIILPSKADVSGLLYEDYRNAVWNCYWFMRREAEDYFRRLKMIEEGKWWDAITEEFRKVINRTGIVPKGMDECIADVTWDFIARSSHIGVLYLRFIDWGEYTIGFDIVPFFPLPNTTVYRIGNTWYLPPNNYTIYYGGVLKMNYKTGKAEVVGGIPIAKVELKGDLTIYLDLNEEVMKEYRRTTLSDAITTGIALWILYDPWLLITLLTIILVYKWKIMRRIRRFRKELMRHGE